MPKGQLKMIEVPEIRWEELQSELAKAKEKLDTDPNLSEITRDEEASLRAERDRLKVDLDGNQAKLDDSQIECDKLRIERDRYRELLALGLTQMKSINGSEEKCVVGEWKQCANHKWIREVEQALAGEK